MRPKLLAKRKQFSFSPHGSPPCHTTVALSRMKSDVGCICEKEALHVSLNLFVESIPVPTHKCITQHKHHITIASKKEECLRFVLLISLGRRFCKWSCSLYTQPLNRLASAVYRSGAPLRSPCLSERPRQGCSSPPISLPRSFANIGENRLTIPFSIDHLSLPSGKNAARP
jgi:hypothetical protein